MNAHTRARNPAPSTEQSTPQALYQAGVSVSSCSAGRGSSSDSSSSALTLSHHSSHQHMRTLSLRRLGQSAQTGRIFIPVSLPDKEAP
jgi:hypothetical protein